MLVEGKKEEGRERLISWRRSSLTWLGQVLRAGNVDLASQQDLDHSPLDPRHRRCPLSSLAWLFTGAASVCQAFKATSTVSSLVSLRFCRILTTYTLQGRVLLVLQDGRSIVVRALGFISPYARPLT